MQDQSPVDQTPQERQSHLALPDFLPRDDHQAILAHALASENACSASRVKGEAGPSSARMSLTIDDIGPCRQIFARSLLPRVQELGSRLGVSVPAGPQTDSSLTAHPDGAFYKPHVDMGGPGVHRSRALSAVYYFFCTPAAFTGGELRLFRLDQPGAFIDIPPVDNQLVMFPSMIPHEVRPVSVPSGRFKDARFAFNIWFHRIPKAATGTHVNP